MRINKLNLEFFGHFHNKSFDFGSEPKSGISDFHVIYGPNESGKTTLKDGYLRLLFGFEKQDKYAYLHQRKNLRVSAELFADGKTLFISRLPTNSPSLRDANDSPLPENTIQSFLGAITKQECGNLYCLDEETIEKGGKEIIEAKSEIGRLLFQSTSGINDLSKILEEVKGNADQIYKKNARTTKFAVLKNEISEIDENLKKLDVTANDYKNLKRTAKHAGEEAEKVRKRRSELLKSKSYLDAKISSFPILSQINELQEKLEDKTSWPHELQFEIEELDALIPEHFKAEGDSERLKVEIAEIQEKLNITKFDQIHLDLKAELELLDELKGRFQTAELDLDKRYNEQEKILSEMNQTAEEISIELETSLNSIKVSKPLIRSLERIQEKIIETTNRISTESGEIDECNRKLKLEMDNLKQASAEIPEGSDLIDLLKRFKVDSFSNRYASAIEVVESAEIKAKKTLASLKLKDQVFNEIPSSQLTLEESENLLKKLVKLYSDIEAAEREYEHNEIELSKFTNEMERVTRGNGVIRDKEADKLREQRNNHWYKHKEALNTSTANSFEKKMFEFDDVEKNRLSRAADLGNLRQLEQQIIDCQNKKKLIQSEIIRFNEAKDDIENTFKKAVSVAKIKSSISPSVFVSWLRKLENVEEAHTDLNIQNEKHKKTFEHAQKMSEELRKLLQLETPEFLDLVNEARSVVENQQNQYDKIKITKRRIEDLKQETSSRCERLKSLESEVKKFKLDWNKTVTESISKSVEANKLLESLEPLRELLKLKEKYSDLTHRISEMEKDQKKFANDVNAIASRVDLDSADNPMHTFVELGKLAENADNLQKQQSQYKTQLEKSAKELESATQKLSQIQSIVDTNSQLIPEELPKNSLKELKESAIKISEVISNRELLKNLRNKLLQTLNVESLQDAGTLLADEPLTELQAKLKEVEIDLSAIEKEFEEVIGALRVSESALNSIMGDAEVAKLEERKSTLKIEKQKLAIDYLNMTLGYKLANEAIRRFRDSHRSTMIKNTEVAFNKLTNGAYNNLEIAPEKNTEILIVIHSNGSAKRAEELSKGTRFQLYLALRAAAYQQLFDQGTCLPFICDDIFETFDEDRTRAACGIMEHIGNIGQAIYLTHHHHVVEIAKDICKENVTIHKF